MIYSETPNYGVIVLSFFQDGNNFIEEISIFQLPKNEIKVENVIVKDILGLDKVKDVLIASRT
jgi:hypothetical protein